MKGRVMKMKRFLALAIVAVFLSGCAEYNIKDAQNQIDAQKIPICKTEQECKMAMSVAYAWVSKNCDMKVQIVNDYAIETFNVKPLQSSMVSCSVVKSANADGSYKLVLSAPCPYGGCRPENWRKASFNREIQAVLPKAE